jgi:SAM-dependent methyltransferase
MSDRKLDTRAHNREAWNRLVAAGDMWTRPVSREQIDSARRGEWSVVLTGLTAVPRNWFPENLAGVELLCLASGGGQQGPLLAAAGAHVTVYDNSPRQLDQDRTISEQHGLGIRLVEGDMAELSCFANESFDLVFHPVSNVFAPDIRPVWREAFRVLRPGGELLAGFMNPAMYLYDNNLYDETGAAVLRYSLPFSELRDLPQDQLAAKRARGEPLEFGHSLSEQIGGQLDAGFQLIEMYENERSDAEWKGPLDRFMPAYIATRAIKSADSAPAS